LTYKCLEAQMFFIHDILIGVSEEKKALGMDKCNDNVG
jgi:hypothetical protein